MALDSRRMQTFFNEFLITTTTFLNQFANECEGKFFELERKLNKIESNLIIIEQKLASVPSEASSLPPTLPDVESLKSIETTKAPEVKPLIRIDQPRDQPEGPQKGSEVEKRLPEEVKHPEPVEAPPVNDNMIKICDSAIYRKYFKMLKVGIPQPAVKQKMSSEGLDSNLLDNPDLLIEKSEEDNEEQ